MWIRIWGSENHSYNLIVSVRRRDKVSCRRYDNVFSSYCRQFYCLSYFLALEQSKPLITSVVMFYNRYEHDYPEHTTVYLRMYKTYTYPKAKNESPVDKAKIYSKWKTWVHRELRMRRSTCRLPVPGINVPSLFSALVIFDFCSSACTGVISSR